MLQLQGLKARGLLEDIGEGLGGVIVHDLCREFAKFETCRGKLSDISSVWHEGIGGSFPTELLKMPPGGFWSNVERVFVGPRYNSFMLVGTVEGIEWQHFANVMVLVLSIGVDQVLDLRGLRCLRSLALRARRGTVSGLGELRNLGWLDLYNINCSPGLREIGLLTERQILRDKYPA